MKHLFITMLLLVGMTASAPRNDCSDNITVYTDPVTGQTSIFGTDYVLVTKDKETGFRILEILSSDGVPNLAIEFYGASSCIDEDSPIYILFTDGTRIITRHMGDFDCDNNAYVFFFAGDPNVNALANKRIKTMRVDTEDGYVQEDFSYENQTKFRDQWRCLIEYGLTQM